MSDLESLPPVPEAASSPPGKRRNLGCWIALGLMVAVLLVVFVGILVMVLGFIGSLAGSPVQVSRGSMLEIQLVGPVTQAPPEVDLGPLFSAPVSSFWEMREAILEAENDPNIAGVHLWIHNAALGWGTATELVGLLDEFRANSGKPVVARLQSDQVTDLDYYLATGADEIWITPQALVLVNGLVAESQFFRGTLEKLRIEPQVLMYKEYKSAGEQYGSYEMSDPMREALEAMLGSISHAFSVRVVSTRGMDNTSLNELVSKGVLSVADALEANLVDRVGYRDEVEDSLAALAGVDQYRGTSLGTYSMSLRPSRSGGVALVFGEGAIVSEPVSSPFPGFGIDLFSGPRVASHIRQAIDDPSVEAIVIRVDSPGGSPVGSDLVLREVLRAREAGKPVVVSMADVAASGGYWVAMGADRIVAQPTTITGSIGVVFSKFNLDGFWEWIGAGSDSVKTADNADIMGWGTWDAADREAIETWMDQVYDAFTNGVAQHRDLDPEFAESNARGRVWSGRDALDIGLIDGFGGLTEAIELAEELAGVDIGTSDVEVFPRPKTLFESMMDDGWVSSRPTVPSQAQLIEWATRLARPQVQVRADEISIH